MRKRILHITEKPLVVCYDPHPHSIIPVNENYMNWIYENYIQLSSFKNINDRINFTWIEFIFLNDYHQNNPFVNVEVISDGEIMDHIDDFIIDCIDRNKYVGICVDRFYIHEHHDYNLSHEPHGLLIYGYDLEEKVFYTMDFYKGIYSCRKVPISEIVKGYTAETNEPKVMSFIYEENVKYELDIQKVFRALEDYYLSTDQHFKVKYSLNPDVPKTFGLDVYRVLKQLYEVTAIEKKRLDIRPLHNLFEHKKRMVYLLEYLSQKMLIEIDPKWISGYKEIMNEAESLRNMLIKIELTKNDQYSNRFIQSIVTLSDKEKVVLGGLINQIIK
ncbi:hypothetical protein SAMN05661091_1363 [Paenibacillus uliginis N3/975]|uniref:Butirosin biosynthesis protein H, N-terminal n=1 Tax=Paenibacillus uliginis N3/975 TaxID=1313296 RepID=A0A1X7GZI8_9BACL|nr:hypothetical protein [Paenibacillus uliginis]SMF76875.1 hypothetical protein SAMN05661091_1363 [Paenibacillus uliginis N3/975]